MKTHININIAWYKYYRNKNKQVYTFKSSNTTGKHAIIVFIDKSYCANIFV